MLRWAVSRGMTATFHWHNDRAVHHLLDVLERVNAETPIAKLRWSIAHLNDASPESSRAHEGDGDGLAGAERVLFPRRGVPRPARRRCRARRRRRLPARCGMGLPVGGGTDAHRVMGPNPFVSLQWMLDGKTVSGVAMRAPEELPTRHRSAAALHARQRLVQLRRERARRARSRSARRSRGAEPRLPHACRSSRSAAPSRCSPWSAGVSSTPTGRSRVTRTKSPRGKMAAVWPGSGLRALGAERKSRAARLQRNPAAERRPRPVTGTFARNSRRAWACRKDSLGLRRSPSRAGWMRFRHLRCLRQSPRA